MKTDPPVDDWQLVGLGYNITIQLPQRLSKPNKKESKLPKTKQHNHMNQTSISFRALKLIYNSSKSKTKLGCK